jgi:hypothetical protein
MTERPSLDDFIECSECGHTLEHWHGPAGCTLGHDGWSEGDEGCACEIPWEFDEVCDLRERLGLPRKWY